MTAAPLHLLVVALVAIHWADSQREIVPDGTPVRQLYVRLSPAESLQVTVAGHGEPVVLIPGLLLLGVQRGRPARRRHDDQPVEAHPDRRTKLTHRYR